jgi:hypothetical protein
MKLLLRKAPERVDELRGLHEVDEGLAILGAHVRYFL